MNDAAVYKCVLAKGMHRYFRDGRNRMVVGFTTTICNQCLSELTFCEFESRLGEVYSIQHYVIQFVSDLR